MDKTVGFLKEKLTDKETLYGIMLFCFGIYMFQYTSKLDYVYRLLYRFVMLLIVMFIYRKFINKGDMKTTVKNFKLKEKLHKMLILIGVVEFITMFIVVFINGGYEAQTPTQSLQEVEYAVE
ncbi:hypothetical protein P4359_33110, partial [Bacillus thuringiensis]|nr:hypothetical protein [Bacillus thuringiensis]